MNPRNHVVYQLKQGNKIVYIGTTKKEEQREEAHKKDKEFDKLVPVSRRMTEEGAKEKEAEMLKNYRRNHNGKNPKYNKDSDG